MAFPYFLKRALDEATESIPAYYGAVPAAGAVIGANAGKDENKIRNALIGAVAGAGALGGGYLGHNLSPAADSLAGTVGGAGVGGLLGLIAARAALEQSVPTRRQKWAASPVIENMKTLKMESDRRNYSAKHKIIRDLLNKHPKDFHVDSTDGDIVGITHKSGFRFHTPVAVLPGHMLAPKTPATV